MTRAQFALAIRGEEKWVENAARLLGRSFSYSLEEAVWLGLVRVFNQEVGLTLSRAAELADEALGHVAEEGTVQLGHSEQSNAAVSIDLARHYSAHAASLSAALDMGGPKRRGRPRVRVRRKTAMLERASEYGIDVDLLREGLRLTPGERLERLDENAQFLNALRPVRPSKS
jgi:hypothetical protein